MKGVRVKVADIVYHLAVLIEKHYPFGFSFDSNHFWELIDEAFVDEALQNYKDTALYEGFVDHIPTEVLDSIFEEILNIINVSLDRIVDEVYRYKLPDVVYYDGDGIYTARWRVCE